MTESVRLPAASLKPSTVALPGFQKHQQPHPAARRPVRQCLRNPFLLKSDDTDRMLEALDKLGVQIEHLAEGRLKVHGTGGRFPNRSADLFWATRARRSVR